MKKAILISAVILHLCAFNIYGQCDDSLTNEPVPTSIGMIIYSNDVETMWNALRFANFSKNEGDTVSIFLLGKGVELDTLIKLDNDLKEQTELFLDNGGIILGCGTCLQSRKLNEPEVCKLSSMGDLYEIVRQNKIVLTF